MTFFHFAKNIIYGVIGVGGFVGGLREIYQLITWALESFQGAEEGSEYTANTTEQCPV